MRYALLAVLVALAAGCSGPRTATTTTPVGRHDVAAPVYDQPRDVVRVAAARAARGYFNGQEIVEEPEAGLLHVVDRETWSGDATIDIVVVALDERQTRVDVVCQGFGRNKPVGEANTRRRVENYLKRLDAEVRDVVELADVAAAQTGAAAAGASGTSRP